MKRILLTVLAVLFGLGAMAASAPSTISLNGTWDVAISNSQPASYVSTVKVPGVITMATPSLGKNLDELDDTVDYDYVWYRRTFRLGDESYPVALLRLRAKYTAEVFLNGKRIGFDDATTYSHGVFDVSDAVKYGAENELVVKVGSWNKASYPSKDNSAEWWRNTRAPGLWDDVELILDRDVYVSHIKALPSVPEELVNITATVVNTNAAACPAEVSAIIYDGDNAVVSSSSSVTLTPGSSSEVVFQLPGSNLETWMPGKEGNPKLYRIEISVRANEGESVRSDRFGYRSISVDGRDVLLNGSKIIFRAENIAFARAVNRWAEGLYDEDWLRNFMHVLVHDYNFNYLRIHLGHAYSRLYDIADEEGMMIEDEWRFMHDADPLGADREATRREFSRWISDNVNHASIVAWDQENEGNVRITDIIEDLRAYDPSRLWSEQDFIQKHIYEYSERVVDGFGGYQLPTDKPYTVLESCRLWANEFGNLELREDFKTSRTTSGWGLFYYTEDDLAQLLDDIHADIGTFYRSERIQAWAPFAVLSGKVNGHNFFKGDIVDSLVPQRNLLQLARLNEPVGASVKMDQAIEWYKQRRIYAPGKRQEMTVAVWNDFGGEAKLALRLEVRNADGKRVSSARSRVSVPAYLCEDCSIKVRMPRRHGAYELVPVLKLKDGRKVEGVIRRVMVADSADEFGQYLAFGGRTAPVDGCHSIFENFTRTTIPASVQDSLISATGDRLVDKLKIQKDGSYRMQVTKYETSKHLFITNFVFDGNGCIVKESTVEALPYITLPEPVRNTLVAVAGAVPEDERRIIRHQGADCPVYEFNVVGIDRVFKLAIKDDGTLVSEN